MNNYIYTIYQVEAKEDFAFKDWERIKKFNLNWSFEPYKIEWGGITKANDDYELLERLFVDFNINHPFGFMGHSMSISDIVKICIKGDEDKAKYYFCDARGWKDITKEIKGEE